MRVRMLKRLYHGACLYIFLFCIVDYAFLFIVADLPVFANGRRFSGKEFYAEKTYSALTEESLENASVALPGF